MSNGVTPQLAGEKAEALILQYANDLGIRGDADLLARCLEMLLSKTSIAIAQVKDKNTARNAVLRTQYNLDKVFPDKPRKSFN